MAKIESINISTEKGVKKQQVEEAVLMENFGIMGDAHAGKWHRQVSFLGKVSIDKMIEMGGMDLISGDFAENITTSDIDLLSMRAGDCFRIGEAELVVSQLGKECHKHCEIYHSVGDCVMPREGIFAIVKKGGNIKVGDSIEKIEKKGFSAAVITLSDKGSKGERTDETGPAVVQFLKNNIDVSVSRIDMIADDEDKLEGMIKFLVDYQGFDLVITNGSTGIAPRDIAPDVTEKIIDKRLPGYEEAMRMESFKITNRAIISRAVCGTRRQALIINLPGSPKGAVENLSFVIGAVEHTIKKLQGDKEDCAN